jgi:hypothetical protein
MRAFALASLPAEAIELLRGTQFAHDSHEVQAEMFWTGKLSEVFSTSRGYSVRVLRIAPSCSTGKRVSLSR